MKTAAQFPTVQEQINYWNKKEGEELDRVSRIQEAESRDVRRETGDVQLPKEDYDNLVRDAMLWRKQL